MSDITNAGKTRSSVVEMMRVFGVATLVMATGLLNAQDLAGDGDGGAEIIAIAESNPQATTPAAAEQSDEIITAEERVDNRLSELNLYVGYDRKRKAIIAKGTASVAIEDPASNPNFLAIRAAKANEAYLDAKAEIIRAISTEFSAMDRALTMGEYGEDLVSKQFAANQRSLEEKREELAKKIAQLDQAEAAALRGVTMNDRFGAILDGIAKRLDGKASAADVAAQKKALFEQIKSECESVREEYKALENLAKDLPKPSTENSSTMAMISKMPLLGSSVLTSAESWDPKDNNTYSFSLAIVWSPKLQENAEALADGIAAPSSQKGKFSPREWATRQDFASMIGPRRFTDDEGNNIFVGIAAADMTGSVKDRKPKRMLAEIAARRAIALSLAGDIEAYREASENYKEYSDDLQTSMQKLNDRVSQKCNVNLQGCLPLIQKVITHPITGHKIYVAAYYIDPMLSKDATDLMQKAFSGAVRQTRAMQFRRGQIEGMNNALENQRNSKDEFNRGRNEGSRSVIPATTTSKPMNSNVPVSAGAAGSKSPVQTGKSQGGTFSGDADIDTDF